MYGNLEAGNDVTNIKYEVRMEEGKNGEIAFNKEAGINVNTASKDDNADFEILGVNISSIERNYNNIMKILQKYTKALINSISAPRQRYNVKESVAEAERVAQF